VKRVIVVGAGGFGRECLDVIEAINTGGATPPMLVLGVADSNPSPENLGRLDTRGIAYLGTEASCMSLFDASETYIVVGVGNPKSRALVAARWESSGFNPVNLIHPEAVVGSQFRSAPGLVVCSGAIMSTNVSVGRHVHVNPGAIVGHDTCLGDFVSINPGAVISGEVQIGSHTLVGASATVLENRCIGERVVVGAHACVTKDLPPGVRVAGVPARLIEKH
jgi:sugar O-acyltransferase (sialic acid O-acetyltransferase NeuD family)